MATTTAPTATDEIDELLVRMFSLITDGLDIATKAFLENDRAMARSVVAADRQIDELQLAIERLIEERLTRGRPVEPESARLLISMLRIAPELERSGDLIEHIALRTPQRLVAGLTPRARALLTEMAALAVKLWARAAGAFTDRDGHGSREVELRNLDDALDDLHVEFTAELPACRMTVPEAVELGLVARFYERLGDHAVNVASHVRRAGDG